ncbi:MAG: CRTAC1 family protein [Planctomycetota bacterium]|nr:CRTAC1 family protein [Planctomycetota bacterium]
MTVFAGTRNAYDRDAVSNGAAPRHYILCCATVAINLLVLAPALGGDDSASMVERLARVAEQADPARNPYLNQQRVEIARRPFREATSPKKRLQTQGRLAFELLLAGDAEAAVRGFERLRRLTKQSNVRVPPQQFLRLRELEAIAFLRLGEQENCLARHSADSCLIPIQGNGIHIAQRGSRRAINSYTQLLNTNPANLSWRWLLNIAYMTVGEYPDKIPAEWLIPPGVFTSDYDIERFHDVSSAAGLDTVGLAGGVVVEDFDKDRLLDVMVSSWGLRDQIRYFVNNGDGTFTERTREAGLTGITGGLNICHADYNNDGYPDVLVLRGGWLGEEGRHPNSLLRNNGDGTFEDVTEEAGLLSFHPTQTAAWGDFDNDGRLDLFIGNETPLFHRAKNKSARAVPRNGSWMQFVKTDERTVTRHPCELYHNNGDGTFTECAAEAGVDNIAFVKAVAWGDYDNDGRQDLFLSRIGNTNVLFRNNGPARELTTPRPDGQGKMPGWSFTNVSAAAGIAEPVQSFPAWFWDYDNDGWLDIFVSGYGLSSMGDVAADYLGLSHKGVLPKLYRNQANGKFTDVTDEVGLDTILFSMGASFGDLDNDGWLDFYVGTGEPDYRALMPNRMFRNASGRRFQDVTSSGGFGHIQKGHGIAFADIDNDGDQDVFAVMGGAYSGDVFRNSLFENPGHGNRWISLRLVGVKSNYSAIGARISVRVNSDRGPRTIHRIVSTGGSFGSTTLRQEIGLGRATSISSIEVRWPATGETQCFENVAMDNMYEILEGSPDPIPIRPKQFDFSRDATVCHPENR